MSSTPLIEAINDLEGQAGRALSEPSNAAAFAEETATRARSILRTLDDLRCRAHDQDAEMFRLQQENSRLLYDLREATEPSTAPVLRLHG